MALPIFDSIDLPPDATLVDVNSLSDAERDLYQGQALTFWIEEMGADWSDLLARDWDDNEGIFVVVEGGVVVGVAIITDVENA